MYILDTSTGNITRISDGKVIVPSFFGDPDTQEYYAWVKLGNSPTEITSQGYPLIILPMWQAREALFTAGYLTAVQAVIDGLDFAAQNKWDKSIEIYSNNPLVHYVLSNPPISLTAAQIYQLFFYAQSIV